MSKILHIGELIRRLWILFVWCDPKEFEIAAKSSRNAFKSRTPRADVMVGLGGTLNTNREPGAVKNVTISGTLVKICVFGASLLGVVYNR